MHMIMTACSNVHVHALPRLLLVSRANKEGLRACHGLKLGIIALWTFLQLTDLQLKMFRHV